VFANEFYDISKKLGADYKLVKEAVVKDPRIGDSHFDIHHGNYRGYGGSCFPKDINAIIELASSRKIKTDLLKAMREINKKYLKQSGLTEEYFLKNLHKKKK
ncbi:MAG: UDP-glucose 6-dehydrogenase, partial [Candidatus Wildermuthbacteria bacterium]|nr:UDP-glucose 6-dehydrogenase [Candidatus Wildermuthbacteria bacterium]